MHVHLHVRQDWVNIFRACLSMCSACVCVGVRACVLLCIFTICTILMNRQDWVNVYIHPVLSIHENSTNGEMHKSTLYIHPECSLFYRALLQKRPIILRSLSSKPPHISHACASTCVHTCICVHICICRHDICN